jgi:predicted ATP-grasp superfamily ATP-dependent carboligase
MVSQEELIKTFVEHDGVLSTRDIREIYNIPSGTGLGSIGNRLRSLIQKKVISKVAGLNGEVIYFIIDFSVFNADKKHRKKYSLSEKDLKKIEKMIKDGYTLKEIAADVGISYRWCKELYRRYRTHGFIFLKKDGRPLRGTT